MVIFLLVITFCRLIIKSCRIFDSKLLKRGGCATFKVIFCGTIYFDFSMTDFKLLFQWLFMYSAYKCVCVCVNVMHEHYGSSLCHLITAEKKICEAK